MKIFRHLSNFYNIPFQASSKRTKLYTLWIAILTAVDHLIIV